MLIDVRSLGEIPSRRNSIGHVFVLEISILSLSTIFLLDIGTVPKVSFLHFISPLVLIMSIWTSHEPYHHMVHG
jgi:uncharacterized membrane protein